jgi:hypothetical protein
MENKTIQSILRDVLEKEFPSSQIQLWPAVQTVLVARGNTSFQQGEKVNVKSRRTSRLALVSLVIIALLALTFLTPQGRAWAQEVTEFFRRINSIMIELPAEQLKQMNNDSDQSYDLPLVPVFIPTVSPEIAAVPGCETQQKSQSYRCQVALAESKLGFDLKELPEKPKDWEFQSLSFDKDSRYAVMSYKLDIRHISGTSYSSLRLVQGAGDFSDFTWYKNNPWEAVPADKVEPVSIGQYKGEYVMGSFGLRPGDAALTWFEDTREQRLIWSEDGRWYLIDFSPNLNVAGTMDKDQLILLAESLVASPITATEPLNPAYLTSISDAEKMSGLDLKAPTLLPMNMRFLYARSFPGGKQVQLIYGDNEELIIQEWEGKPLKIDQPSGIFQIVSINGNDGYFESVTGSEPRLSLLWYKDGLNYRINYNQSFGWHIDKEKMISIAESMQDIDDFSRKNRASYEQLALYEQALGMNAKKFLQIPAEWVFTNFWADAYTQCIDLIYTATVGQDTLFISQCKTDKRFDLSVFPAKSMEQVNLRNTKGQYIAGDYVMGNDGKSTWDPNSPIKQLSWKEDGLWMQISIYGENAALLDKKDLVSIAESLH